MVHRPLVWVACLPLAAILFPAAAPAATQDTAPEEPTVAERCAAAESFLTQRLFLWQKRLKLEDWNITFKLVRVAELKPKTLGNIHWDSEEKKANISILNPADYKLAFPEALRDIEFTIVHELVHLQLSSLPRNE